MQKILQKDLFALYKVRCISRQALFFHSNRHTTNRRYIENGYIEEYIRYYSSAPVSAVAVIPLNIRYPLLSPRAAIPHIPSRGPYFCTLASHAHPAAVSRSALLARVSDTRGYACKRYTRPHEAANMRSVKRKVEKGKDVKRW